jgi:hypothetical protein
MLYSRNIEPKVTGWVVSWMPRMRARERGGLIHTLEHRSQQGAYGLALCSVRNAIADCVGYRRLMRSPAELTTWGWHEAGYDQADNCLFADSGYENQNRIGEALRALGLDPFPKEGMQGDNECYSLEHFDEDGESYDEPDFMEQTYNANGITYSVRRTLSQKSYLLTLSPAHWRLYPIWSQQKRRWFVSPFTAPLQPLTISSYPSYIRHQPQVSGLRRQAELGHQRQAQRPPAAPKVLRHHRRVLATRQPQPAKPSLRFRQSHPERGDAVDYRENL